MEFQPLVSIVIPVYNGSNFVRQAIDSALSQTYKNIEIIVVNDGSKDEGATEQIALSYGDKIRYIHKENGGVSSALNVGIKNMRGEYFSWLSHDDMYKPDKIERQVELLNKYGKENSLVLCSAEHINAKSECIKAGVRKKELKIGVNTYDVVLKSLCVRGSYNGCAFLIPKEAFDKAGLFDESLRYSQDAFMWLQIFFNRYNLIYDHFDGVCNRIHGGQLTQRGREIFYKDSHYISKVIIPKIVNEKEHSRALLYAYAKYHAKMNCTDTVKDCFAISKKEKILGLGQRINLRFTAFYGKLRPFIRRVYYRLFRKMKTN